MILGRTRRDIAAAYGATIPALGLGVLGYLVFGSLYRLATGV